MQPQWCRPRSCFALKAFRNIKPLTNQCDTMHCALEGGYCVAATFLLSVL